MSWCIDVMSSPKNMITIINAVDTLSMENEVTCMCVYAVEVNCKMCTFSGIIVIYTTLCNFFVLLLQNFNFALVFHSYVTRFLVFLFLSLSYINKIRI